MNKRIIFFISLFMLIVVAPVFGQELTTDIEKFRENNPDGRKYEFVKTYITALGYIYDNDRRSDQPITITANAPQDRQIITQMIDNIVMNNVNLRISRNLIEKYLDPDNGLMLQAADLFVKVCNELIELNQQERAYLTKLYGLANNVDQSETVVGQDYVTHQLTISNKRKEALRKLVKSSIFVTRVLVSPKANFYGELTKLGITSEERHNLIRRLDRFDGSHFEGEMREGQSYLEASIATLKEFLEDYQWDTVDG